MEEDLPRHGITVLQGCRETVLRGQPVVHGHHRPPGEGRHVGADRVIAVDVPGHPAAAVEEEEDPAALLPRRREDAHGDVPVAAGDLVLPHPVQIRVSSAPGGELHQFPLQRVHFFHIQLRVAQGGQRRPHGFVDGHRPSFSGIFSPVQRPLFSIIPHSAPVFNQEPAPIAAPPPVRPCFFAFFSAIAP